MINEFIPENKDNDHIYYTIIRNNLLNLIEKDLGNCLEIGCGTGENLVYLKKKGAQKVTGIELRADVAAKAKLKKEIDFIFNIDFLDNCADVEGAKYNTVVLSHVLEHFPNPDIVLAKVSKIITPEDGTLLIAVPNIRHLSVLVGLILHGDFDYKDSGIMDYTHLKFFTKKSIQKVLIKNGFEVINSQMDFAGPRSRFINKITFGVFEEYFGFAINLSAKLKN